MIKEERNFYAFEIENCGGNFVKVRKILNGKCIYEGSCKWLSREDQEKLKTRMMYETFYKNYQKEGLPKVFNLNGFEIVKEEGKFLIKYFTCGVKTAQSSYDLKWISEEKEKIIIRKLSNLCLNNMEVENQGYSLIFIIREVERVIYN